MSDKSTFMTLPSLVRQALENTAGECGRDIPSDPYSVITVNNCDWLIIRDHLISLQDQLNDRKITDVL
jgi:hypothetical protein